jgi:uncharacterized protein (DUF488 family)
LSRRIVIALPLLTIGYETSTQSEVVDALADAGVETLVDVRAVSASRRAGFSKRHLSAAAQERGIDYVHLRGLGTPPEGRQAARSGRPERMRTIYEAHLAMPEAQADFSALTRLVRSGRRVCLLCYERDPRHCHRSLIAEHLAREADIAVEHLFAGPF